MSRLLLVLFSLAVALAPLPLGSNRDWAWSPLAAVIGALLLGCAVLCCFDSAWRQRALQPFGSLRIPGALFALVVAWGVLQVSGWTPASWATSMSASSALGMPDRRWSVAFDVEQQWTALMRLLTYAGVFVLAAVLGRNASDARRILGAIVLIATLTTLYSMAAIAINLQTRNTGISVWMPMRIRDYLYFTGTFVNGNNYATYSGMAALAALALAFRPAGRDARSETLRERYRRRLAALSGAGGVWFALALILIMGVVMSVSRAGAFSFVLGLMAMAAFYGRGAKRIVLAAAVPLLLAVVVMLTPGGGALVQKLSRLMIEGESGRQTLFPMTIKAIELRPMTGWGMNSFGDLYGVFQPPALRDYFDKAHNTYLELAFDLGVIGAATLLLSVALIVWHCAVGFANRGRDRELAGLGLFATVLVGFHALFDFGLQIPAVACTYFAILGVAWAQSWSSRQSISR